jgi:hypothetical protein
MTDGDPPDDGSENSPGELVGSVRDDGYLNRPHDVEVEDGYAYLPGKGGTLGIVDVSDPTDPEVVAGFDDFENAQTVGLDPREPILFVAEGQSIHAVDVSAPERPERLGSAEDAALGRVNGWTRHRDVLFTASKSGSLGVVDVSDPRSPSMVGAFHVGREEHGGVAAPHDAERYEQYVLLPNQMEGSHPKGGLVRVLDDDGEVLPVEAFETVGTFDDDRLDGANRVLVDGEIAYVANNYAISVGSIDLSAPHDVEILDVAPASQVGPNGITFHDGRLAAGSGVFVDVFDVEDPGAIEPVGRIADEPNLERPGSAHDLETVGDLAFVSGQASNRLNVYRLR